MTGFDFRPSRPIAVTGVAVAVLIIVLGVVTFVREGFGWFSLVWLACAAVVLVGLVRKFLTTRTSRDPGLRPSKPMTVVAALVGAGMLVFGIVKFGRSDPLFIVFWVAALLLIVGGQVWSAFRTPK